MDYDRHRDTYARDLDRAVSFAGRDHTFFTRAKAEQLVELVRRHAGDPRTADVVDVGCGVGLTDRFLRGAFRTLTGVDVTPGVLETAAAENPWARYVRSDGETLPLEDDSFDVSVSICVVQVVEPAQRPRFVGELARVTRPGGLVVVFEHNPLNPLTRIVVRRCSYGADARMLREGELARLFTGAGLETVDRGYLLLLPSRHPAAVAVEQRLRALPLGSQYYRAARVR